MVSVDGCFKKGDAVAVTGSTTKIVFGCGITNYAVNEITPGKKSDREVIHRDDFIRSESGWFYQPYRYCIKRES